MQREMERGEEKYQVCKKGRRRRKTDSEPDSMPRLATHFFFRPGENEREKESKESDEPDSMPRLATRGHGRAWREVEKLEERKPRYKLRIVVGCNKGGNGSIGDSAGFSAGLHRGSVDAGSGCWRKQGSSTWRSLWTTLGLTRCCHCGQGHFGPAPSKKQATTGSYRRRGER